MDTETHGQKAEAYFKQGYNCSQAVLLAFADECNLAKDTALRLASSFGGGMGRMREVCGAVSAMFMVAGMKYGDAAIDDNEGKKKHYERIQYLAKQFIEKNGSIVCRELLGLKKDSDEPAPEPRNEQYYKKRPCGELIHLAADIMEEYINVSD